MLYDDRDRVGVRNLVLTATAFAWVLWIWTARLAGTHVHSHTTNGLTVAAGAIVNWLLMLTAMMAPVLIQPIQFIRSQGLARRRGRATLLFVIAYASIWTVGGAVMFSIAARVDSTGLPPVVPAAAALAIAAFWQCSPAKQVFLNRCHQRVPLAAFGRRADTCVLRFGATHAGWCIGSCGALMLVPLMLPGGHVAAMMAVALLIFCERLERPAAPGWHWRGLGTVLRMVAIQVRIQRTQVGALRLNTDLT